MKRENAMALFTKAGEGGASAMAEAFVGLYSMPDYEIVVGRDTVDPAGGDDEHWVVILIRKNMIGDNPNQRNRLEVVNGAYLITENGVENKAGSAFVSPQGNWIFYRG